MLSRGATLVTCGEERRPAQASRAPPSTGRPSEGAMLAVSLAESQGSRFKVRLFVQWAFVAVASVALAGCAGVRGNKPLTAASGDNSSSFGGAPAVEIPSSAYAMGAYLKALVATEGGDRHEALGDDPTAEQQYLEVMKLEPKNQEAYLFLGTIYAQRGEYTKAEDVFKKLISLDATSFLGYYYAGRVMVAAKNYPAADHYYDKALELNSQSELALLDLAVLRELESRPKDASVLYHKILQVNPNNDIVRKRLAEMYGGDAKIDHALAQLQRQEQIETNP